MKIHYYKKIINTYLQNLFNPHLSLSYTSKCWQRLVENERNIKTKLIYTLSTTFMLIILTTAALNASDISIVVAPTINIRSEEIKRAIQYKIPDENISIQLLIYYYTDGVETISYTEDENFVETTGDGTAKAVVKIMKKGKLKQAVLVKSHGRDRDVIFKNLSEEIQKVLKKEKLI